MSEQNLCFGCMGHKSGDMICPHCGFDNNSAAAPNAIEPGTKIHDRYIIGKVLDHNGEGMTYIAYDTNIGCKVTIREYLPVQLCNRVDSSAVVNVNYNHLAQYKSLMAEYTELNKALARQRSLVHLNPALDLFSENNTTYAVYEFLEGRNLLEYLKENAGELSWKTVSRMFPPLFTTLSILHNAGVLHRGISPETIFVTDKGDIKLTGFCISAVRTNDTELEAELFEGYAAPEQYFANRQQGTWTDVYGICAVLYRILTGCRATDANTRQNYDNLVPPRDLNSHVPKHVSDAIMKGLSLDGNSRIRTITDLVTALFESEDEEVPAPTPVPRKTAPVSGTQTPRKTTASNGNPKKSTGTKSAAAAKNNHTQNSKKSQNVVHYREEQEESVLGALMDRIRIPILIGILMIVILGIIIIAFSQLFNKDGNETLPSTADHTSSLDNIIQIPLETTMPIKYNAIMPNLVNMNFKIKQNQMAGWLDLEPQYEYNDEFEKDIIFEQELEEGAGFVSGSTVKVKVSLGSSKKQLPDFNGYKVQAYIGKLVDMGFVEAVEEKGGNIVTTTTVTTTAVSTLSGETTTARTMAIDPDGKQKVIFKGVTNKNFSNGFVCDIDPPVGTVVDMMKGYTITIYYADNPVFTVTKATSTTKSGSSTTTTTTKKGDSGTTISGTGGGSATQGSTTQTQQQTQATQSQTQATQSQTQATPPQTQATQPPQTQTQAPPPPPPPADNHEE